MANQIVAGEQYYDIDGQLGEIKRQLRQKGGYPFDSEMLQMHLQAAIEGRWSVENLLRVTNELTLQIPALAPPTLKELQSKWDWIESIERDSSPTKAVTLKLATILRVSEGSVNGDEYEKRIARKLDLILGYQQAVWLVEHQDEFPEFMALLGKVYIDFSGLVVVRSGGYRNFPYLIQSGERWYLGWRWVGRGFGSDERVALSGE